MNLVQRKLLMSCLLGAFCVQTAFVYLDDTADKLPRLSEEAVQGRRIWHAHNCQVCHQIHGFGGFLGPDLTNAAPRLTTERLHQVLTDGTGQMPAFHLGDEQIALVTAYLDELPSTGVGVSRRHVPVDPMKVRRGIEEHMVACPPPDAVRRGFQLFCQNCTVCHVPFQATPLGLQTAPDLTTVVERLDDDAVRATLKSGRPDRGMPAWALPAPAIDEIVAMLHWWHDERAPLAQRIGGVGETQPLPWWEYR
ncbi:MAG TPA: c-type cytochrome [Planctomycetota bacterium]|nr:c-type cytochrome [Planctomycetota bacterium]